MARRTFGGSRLILPRILAVADQVSPVIDSVNFPSNLPGFDLALSAGDMPGRVLEYMADRLGFAPVFVKGNHPGEQVRDPLDPTSRRLKDPGGCINAHGRVVHQSGLIIVGFEGSARYRPGPQQYSERQFAAMARRLAPVLHLNRLRYGRALDILLTHAPPTGPHAGTDHAHRGVPAFERFSRIWRPRLHLHGHVHLVGSNAPREYVTAEGVRVVNGFEFALIDL